ncbi:MAG: trypsin-like peptidase domain-containing protein, partial [Oscillospiraceae bacterium]|nr:trypsin-like peptidase domain-containing protein [Oscillospiraceae bacterium]
PIEVKTIFSESSNSYAPNFTPKKKGNGGIIAVVICCCIIFSSLCGIGGGILTYTYLGNNADIPSGVNNVTAPETEVVNSIIKQAVEAYENPGTNSADSIVNATAIAHKTVVEILTETQVSSYFGRQTYQGAGSGVIITDDGYILTCAHVVDGARKIMVTLSTGEEYEALLVGLDSQTDIAVLKIDADVKLPAAVIGNSDNLMLGEAAIAIGNPTGYLGGTVSDGIISALGREITIDGQKYFNIVQTSAAVNPGNSGGGLFNIRGELIGIVNAKSGGTEGLGFAISINQAVQIAEELITKGYISGRPRLGIDVRNITMYTSKSDIPAELRDYVDSTGVYFYQYDGNSGDLQLGDRIVAIDDIEVNHSDEIKALLVNYNIGNVVTITVVRKVEGGRRYENKVEKITLTLLEKTVE